MSNDKKKNNKREFERLTDGRYERLSIFRNVKSKYQPSYIAYIANDNKRAIDITGFPARQLRDLTIDELSDYEFDVEVDVKHSEQFDKDFYIITKIVKHKKPQVEQKKLTIEGDD